MKLLGMWGDLDHPLTAPGYPFRPIVAVGLAAVGSIDYSDGFELRWTQVCKIIILKLLFSKCLLIWCAMMRTIPLDDILRVWSQSPNAAAAAWSLGLSRRTLYHRWHSASIEEVLQAMARIAAAYEAQLTGERQARLQERAAAQAQMKAVRKEGVRDRTRLEKRLGECDDALAKALRELTIRDLRGAGMERASKPPRQEIDRLVRENEAPRKEMARLKSTRTERAQGPGEVPVIRRVKRLITLEEDDAGRGGEDRLG
jgi:hypothetical protein